MKLALTQATEDGESYYTLSYEPDEKTYGGWLHKIKVEMEKKGYSLAYRQAYYGMDPEAAHQAAVRPRGTEWTEPPSPRKAGDSLDANMRFGAPVAHGLVFGAHVEPVGGLAMATPEQMAQLGDEPAFFKTRRTGKPAKPIAPMQLQRYRIDYTVMARQLHLEARGAAPQLEIAVAAYDGDGTRLNASVSVASPGNSAETTPQRLYRVEQEFLVPSKAETAHGGAGRAHGSDRCNGDQTPVTTRKSRIDSGRGAALIDVRASKQYKTLMRKSLKRDNLSLPIGEDGWLRKPS